MNVHDVSRCPLGVRCETCGVEGAGLAVATRSTPLGVLCVTLCPPCTVANLPPAVTIATATRLVDQHAAHLERGDLR